MTQTDRTTSRVRYGKRALGGSAYVQRRSREDVMPVFARRGW